jgi:MFS family permease
VIEPTFAILLTLQFVFGVAVSIFLLLPKILSEHLGSGPEGIGVVNAMFAIAGVAVVPLVGARVDRPGRPRLIAAGTLLMMASALAFLAVDHVGPLAVFLRAMQGAAYTIVFVVGAALAVDTAPPEHLARTMGVYGSANLITNAVAPAIAEPMIDSFGYRSVYVVSAVMSLVSFFLARRLTERAPAPGGAAERVGGVGLGAVMRRGRALRIMAAIGLGGIALGATFTFSQPMALARGIREMRGFFIAFTVAVLVVRFLFRDAVDRVGPQRACVAALVLYGIVVFSMRFLGTIGLATLGGAFGVAHGVLFPAGMALSVAGLPMEERGRMLTLTNGAFIGGTALVMPLGVVAARAGYPAVFALGSACALGAAVLLARWPIAGPGAVP